MTPPSKARDRVLSCNGLRMRITEQGEPGKPLVLLVHGWPELAYSWRYQMQPLAEAGYYVVAPDMRGYGGTDAPPDPEDYDILTIVEDLKDLVRLCGARQAVIVGHDWGALIAWHAALLAPGEFRAVAAMSVPWYGLPPAPPMRILSKRHGDQFNYILYHQHEGLAEQEYDADPEGLLRMLYAAPGAPREAPSILDSHRDAGGFIGRWGRPLELPAWLDNKDLQVYIDSFQRSGFRGGLNYYRNFDRNWEFMQGRDPVVRVPALYIAGSEDLVVAGMDSEAIGKRMQGVVPELRHLEWIEGAGHWIQQECPGRCNRVLLEFLAGLEYG